MAQPGRQNKPDELDFTQGDLANREVYLPGEYLPFRRVIIRLYQPELTKLEAFMEEHQLRTHTDAVLKLLSLLPTR